MYHTWGKYTVILRYRRGYFVEIKLLTIASPPSRARFGQATKQFKLNPFTSLRATHNVLARWEIALEKWLTLSPHIRKHSLSKVPTQDLIGRSAGIREEPQIKMVAGNALTIRPEADDLVIVLRELLAGRTEEKIFAIHTSGLIDIKQVSKRHCISVLSNIPF